MKDVAPHIFISESVAPMRVASDPLCSSMESSRNGSNGGTPSSGSPTFKCGFKVVIELFIHFTNSGSFL